MRYFLLSSILFLIGIIGIVVNKKNLITILMCFEIILLGINVTLVASSSLAQDISGQIFSLFILTVIAAEAAVGLAIFICYYRITGSIEIQDINKIQG